MLPTPKHARERRRPELSGLRVYAVAPYGRATEVRALRAHTRDERLSWVSRWALLAEGPEALDAFARDEKQRIAWQNDQDLFSAHVVLVLSYAGEGGEMFSEAGRALERGIPCVWTGKRHTLSTSRPGVLAIEDPRTALATLEGFAATVARLEADVALTRRLLWESFEAANEAADRARAGRSP